MLWGDHATDLMFNEAQRWSKSTDHILGAIGVATRIEFALIGS